ncbi:MAG: hypothetical protein BroJett030_03310 [Alphaproteobacteria bacterium]|nr:MAG: hypothetical protein BroJett030_03310 [Alphaproteobacteria bacterium]
MSGRRRVREKAPHALVKAGASLYMPAPERRPNEAGRAISAPGERRQPERITTIWSSIMAVPKRKTTPSKRGMRRSADALKQPAYVEDKDSGELRRPHHIDLKTGMYRGRQVLEPKQSV